MLNKPIPKFLFKLPSKGRYRYAKYLCECGDTFETIIKYDDKGNWINKSTIGTSEWSSKPDIRIEEREIEYNN